MFSLANHLSLWRLPQGVVGRVPWAEVCPEGCTAAGGARRGPPAVPGFLGCPGLHGVTAEPLCNT